MKKHLLKITGVLFFLNLCFLSNLNAQRPMEKLDRSVVAQKISNGIYVNWRITSDEWYNTSYKLYRDGALIHSTTSTEASNFLDASGTLNSKYTVSAVKNGIESAQSAPASVLSKSYMDVELRDIKKLGKFGYFPNDATAADLDGDGQYEIIVKRLKKDWSASCTDYTYFEAYKLDGTFLWAIDVGPNITMDVEINIAAFDFDGDGKAEVFMRTSDNTIFGLDINNQGGVSVGDRDKDGYTNYRMAPFNGIGGDGFMNAGPEYLSLIDGMTGLELDWVNFIPRGQSSDWGDNYGHRANKFFFGAPYLDGKKPSLFIGRGIYTQTKMETYDIVNKKLVPLWSWESGNSSARQKGKWDESPKRYFGQGYHNFTIADVDDDGKDEINWGSMTIDHDGKPLYSTELGHGDAQHYGDFDPFRKGQEMFACNEDNPGTNLRDAKTGDLLYRSIAPRDVGRAGAGNISDLYKGVEIWGNGVGLSATDKVEMPHFGVAENYCIYWDGDLLQELLDHNFSSSAGVGPGKITKFNGMGNISTLLVADAYSCNYTKGTPCLQADILGDWREEAIWWRTDSMALRIYCTPYPTTHRIYTLMHDHQYRQAICWQMCGYNQPPHTSFYLGKEFPTPIPAKSTNGKMVFMGASANLNATTPNFADGNNAAGLISETAAIIPFSNGKSILLDERATIKSLNLNVNLEPDLLMIAGNDNYSINGTGIFGGKMILDKVGEGNLTIDGKHTYSGKTDIWEGGLQINGELTNSPIIIRRHAGFGGKVVLGNQILTEYNASLFPGGKAVADTMIVNADITLVEGTRLVFDLSDNPTIPSVEATRSSMKNDYLRVNGTVNLEKGAILQINEMADSISDGQYLIMKVNELIGNIANVKIQGSGGKSATLSFDDNSKELYLIIVGTRSASSVVWTGKTNNVWNIAKTSNWSKDGSDDIFVNNDSILFDNTGFSRSINLIDSAYVSHMKVDNSTVKPYSINGIGSLNGSMSLTKNGPGTLNLNNRNSFSGKVVVNQGTLIMQYAPSAINNGGIGANVTDPAYLVLKDSSILQVTNANEQTDRGLNVAGVTGGIINVMANLYWDGLITGTKLTKTGTGTLFIGNSNPNLSETVLQTGTLRLNTNASVTYGVGKKITLLGGTLDTKNDIGAYLTSSNSFDVPAGFTSWVNAAARCEYNGMLTGAGTLNWRTDFIRAYMNGNWSAFEGKLNILKNTGNSTYEDKFIVNSSFGYPNATIDLATGVIMCYKNGTADNGTNLIKIGMLTGAGTVYNAGLEVGVNNTSGSFAGVISGASSIKKSGTGLWMLSGVNTNTGSTTISAGTLTVTGSTGTGIVTAQTGTTLNLTGTAGGMVIVSAGAVANVTGTVKGNLSNNGTLRGNSSIHGMLTLGANSVTETGTTGTAVLNVGGNMTINSSAMLNMQISAVSSSSNRINVTGAMNCAGTLNVNSLSGAPAVGREYQIFNAANFNGTFNEINLPELPADREWNLSDLYTSGKISVVESTGLHTLSFKTTVTENPSQGLFHISTDRVLNHLQMEVYNMQGKILYRNILNIKPENFEIDLTAQPDGIYMLRIWAEGEKADLLKLIKK